MLTVVLKLFHIVNPRLAVFGQKDAQQLACIQRMVLDLNLDIEVVGAPTIRDPDGLATSSRNVFLNPTERRLALSLSTALEKAATQTSVPAARSAAYEILDRAADDPAFALDYATLVHPATFAEVPDDHTGHAIFVVAARVGPHPPDRQHHPDLGLSMDLDEAADQLYAVAPEDFMARRTALAAEAKESGDKALAKQITGLRRPTRSAWLVNLVARAEPEGLAELRELGTALQQAQQQMAGDELRRLSKQRRTPDRLAGPTSGRAGRRAWLRPARLGGAGGEPDPAGGTRRPGGR